MGGRPLYYALKTIQARLPLATNSVKVWQQTGLRLSWNVTAEVASPSLPQRFFARAASTRRPGTSSVWSFRNMNKALNRRVPPSPSLSSSLVVRHLAVVDAPGDCDHLISAGKAVFVTVARPRAADQDRHPL